LLWNPSYFTLNDFAYFESMERNFGIEPKAEHYACMIDLFGRVRLLEEAYELIAKMPIKASIAAWDALLF
jgi:pentatricopeptide repeat protein